METTQPYTTPRRSLPREKEQLISHSSHSFLAADYSDETQSARDNFYNIAQPSHLLQQGCSVDQALPITEKMFLGESAKMGHQSGMLDLDVFYSS